MKCVQIAIYHLGLVLLELLSTPSIGLGPDGHALGRAREVGPSIYSVSLLGTI
jgi:hypothetical protein